MESYEEGLKDPKILELQDEIAMNHTRIKELYKRVDKGESGHLWDRLSELKREYKATYDEAEKASILNLLIETITKGKNDRDSWAEIRACEAHVQKLTDSENKRLLATQQMIPIGSVMAIITSIGLLFERYVKDQDIRNKMSVELGNIITIKAIGETEANG
jgi:hypothetical protein